jgi:hypothetical protein
MAMVKEQEEEEQEEEEGSIWKWGDCRVMDFIPNYSPMPPLAGATLDSA